MKNPMDKNKLGKGLPSRNEETGSTSELKTAAGAPVASNQDTMSAGPRGPLMLQDVWHIEKSAHFNREVIPERRMHAKGSGAFGTFTVTHDITKWSKAKIFSEVGKQTEMFARFSTVAGERGAADAERDIRGFALKFYTEDGNWDMVGNNTPVFFFRDPKKFIDLNTPSSVIRAPICAAKTVTGTSGLHCPKHSPSHYRHERPRDPFKLPLHARFLLSCL